jgi:hypothetical protein
MKMVETTQGEKKVFASGIRTREARNSPDRTGMRRMEKASLTGSA